MSFHPVMTHGGKIKRDNGELVIDQPLNSRKDKQKFQNTCDRYGLKSEPKVKKVAKRRQIAPIPEVDESSADHGFSFSAPNIDAAPAEESISGEVPLSFPDISGAENFVPSTAFSVTNFQANGAAPPGTGLSHADSVTSVATVKKSSLSDAVKTIKKVHDKKSTRNQIVQRVYQTSRATYDTRSVP